MYKINLMPEYDTPGDKTLEIKSEVIFNDDTVLFLPKLGAVILSGKSFDIKDDFKGIEKINYFYKRL